MRAKAKRQIKGIDKNLKAKGVDTDFNVVSDVEARIIIEEHGGIPAKSFESFVYTNSKGRKEIVINARANIKAYAVAIGHEVSHILENASDFNRYVEKLKAHVGDKVWNEELEKCKRLYKNVKNADPELEAIANITGRMFDTKDKGKS